MIGQRAPGAGAAAASPIDPQRPNVVAFPGSSKPVDPFNALTAQLVLDQHRRGVLPEAVVAALLAGIGLL